MPIIDLQRRLHEAGRIRIGEKVETEGGKSRPTRLETFRFTSPNEEAVTALAGIHGGIPQVWEDAPSGKQWEVVTESDSVRVLVPPEAMSFTQFYELWSGGGCQRRCDGVHLIPSDEPCLCDPEDRECKPHTRISVMLADLPTSGLWRLDTSGYNAAVELSGGFELASLISRASGRALLPGTLRLEQREVKRPDQPTRKFAVPVIDFDLDLELLTGNASPAVSPVTPVPTLAARSLAEQLQDVETAPEPSRRANAAEPIKATGLRPRTAAEAGSGASTGDVATMSLRELTAALQEAGLPLTGNTAAKRLRLAEHRVGMKPAPVSGNPGEDEEPF
jgi:hypothetical protein